jgi:hypothetical protein
MSGYERQDSKQRGYWLQLFATVSAFSRRSLCTAEHAHDRVIYGNITILYGGGGPLKPESNKYDLMQFHCQCFGSSKPALPPLF